MLYVMRNLWIVDIDSTNIGRIAIWNREVKVRPKLHNICIDHVTIQSELRYWIRVKDVWLKCWVICSTTSLIPMVWDFWVAKHAAAVRILVEPESEPNWNFGSIAFTISCPRLFPWCLLYRHIIRKSKSSIRVMKYTPMRTNFLLLVGVSSVLLFSPLRTTSTSLSNTAFGSWPWSIVLSAMYQFRKKPFLHQSTDFCNAKFE